MCTYMRPFLLYYTVYTGRNSYMYWYMLLLVHVATGTLYQMTSMVLLDLVLVLLYT